MIIEIEDEAKASGTIDIQERSELDKILLSTDISSVKNRSRSREKPGRVASDPNLMNEGRQTLAGDNSETQQEVDNLHERIKVTNYEEYFTKYNEADDTVHKIIPLNKSEYAFCGEKYFSICKELENGDFTKYDQKMPTDGMKLVNYLIDQSSKLSISVREDNSPKETKRLIFQLRDPALEQPKFMQLIPPLKLTSSTLVLSEGRLLVLTREGLLTIDLQKVRQIFFSEHTDTLKIFNECTYLRETMTDMCQKGNYLFLCSEKRNLLMRGDLTLLRSGGGSQASGGIVSTKLVVNRSFDESYLKEMRIKATLNQVILWTANTLYLLNDAMQVTCECQIRSVIDLEAFVVGNRNILVALHRKTYLSLYLMRRGEIELIEKSIPLEIDGDRIIEHTHLGMCPIDESSFVVYGHQNYHSRFGIKYI